MEIREVMTESVVTAAADTAVRRVAEIMRERNVGSVVLLATGDRVSRLAARGDDDLDSLPAATGAPVPSHRRVGPGVSER